MMKKCLYLLLLIPLVVTAQVEVSRSKQSTKKYFPIASKELVTHILVDADENPLIARTADFLAQDVERITGRQPDVLNDLAEANSDRIIIVGTIAGSKYIGELIADKKLDVSMIDGGWEQFVVATVKSPFSGVKEALVIVGSDRRGAAYGVFTLSGQMGVSPWYWWADVPVPSSDQLWIKKGRFESKSPSVKYRGIFLNDEAPALRGWAVEKFGGFNHQFYEKVFELLLRNKANYLWPAMWVPSAFADDDPLNPQLADEYGIVISTSHHEPMMRAHAEWRRYGDGPWNYQSNKEQLQKFWKGGIERMGDDESVVTVGMRGDGDEAMSEETAVGLMQEIIADQRSIIAETTGKPVSETPQVWAIYKEVQDYYDQGMRVPEDITVLFCDDNWGNVRILPKPEDQDYQGGYGMYYHFDFVGGPVSYRWLNVTQIERVWEQMNLTYEWGVKDLWIVNVGDLKPMEFPISFFLDFAWDATMEPADLPAYYTNWAAQQFGTSYAQEIGEIIALYTKYNARRTPEMITPTTYSLSNYRESSRVEQEYHALLRRSEKLLELLPEAQRLAFYQLVYSPVAMCANLNQMYAAAGKNELYAAQGRASTNFYADQVKELFMYDAELSKEYHELNEGKWNHFMEQTHIGYTSWSNPAVNKMPEVTYIQPADYPKLGYAVEYGEEGRRSKGGVYSKRFAPFDPVNDQTYYLEVFNKGTKPLHYAIEAESWIKLSQTEGTTLYEEKVLVSIDWNNVPQGTAEGEIVINGGGQEFKIKVPLRMALSATTGFIENNGVISIDANHYSRKQDHEQVRWVEVPNLGRTGSSVTISPSNAPQQSPGEACPRLEYDFTLFSAGEVTISTFLSPLLNFKKEDGLQLAIAIDKEKPQVINIHQGETQPDWEYPDWWNKSVTDHIKKVMSVHVLEAGQHTLKIWMVDPGLVFQRFVIDAGGLRESYLGPPESIKVVDGNKSF